MTPTHVDFIERRKRTELRNQFLVTLIIIEQCGKFSRKKKL